MHTQNSAWMKETSIPSNTDAGRIVVEEILAEMRHKEWPEEDIFAVHLALEEALVNAIKHGNQLDESKQVHVDCRLSHDQLLVEIGDEGTGFAPDSLPDPTLDENLECPSGRGVMLMRGFMTEVDFNDVGNVVSMLKRRSAEAE